MVQEAQIEHLKTQLETYIAATRGDVENRRESRARKRASNMFSLQRRQGRSVDRLRSRAKSLSRSQGGGVDAEGGRSSTVALMQDALGEVESLSRQLATMSVENERLRAVIESQAGVARDNVAAVEDTAGRAGFKEGVTWLGREVQLCVDRLAETLVNLCEELKSHEGHLPHEYASQHAG